MSIEELKKKFIVDEDVFKARLEILISQAMKHCILDKKGQVHITDDDLATRDKVRLVLTARAIAAQLEATISADVGIQELSKAAGIPANQARARAKDVVSEKFAESPTRGVYRALLHKIEHFLNSIDKDHIQKP